MEKSHVLLTWFPPRAAAYVTIVQYWPENQYQYYMYMVSRHFITCKSVENQPLQSGSSAVSSPESSPACYPFIVTSMYPWQPLSCSPSLIYHIENSIYYMESLETGFCHLAQSPWNHPSYSINGPFLLLLNINHGMDVLQLSHLLIIEHFVSIFIFYTIDTWFSVQFSRLLYCHIIYIYISWFILLFKLSYWLLQVGLCAWHVSIIFWSLPF